MKFTGFVYFIQNSSMYSKTTAYLAWGVLDTFSVKVPAHIFPLNTPLDDMLLLKKFFYPLFHASKGGGIVLSSRREL